MFIFSLEVLPYCHLPSPSPKQTEKHLKTHQVSEQPPTIEEQADLGLCLLY